VISLSVRGYSPDFSVFFSCVAMAYGGGKPASIAAPSLNVGSTFVSGLQGNFFPQGCGYVCGFLVDKVVDKVMHRGCG
jgi:hypothetical protein